MRKTFDSSLFKESVKLQSEIVVVSELLRKCVEENVHSALNQADYEERYKALAEKYQHIQKELESIEAKQIGKRAKKENLLIFMNELDKGEDLFEEFDEGLWNGIIDKAVVNDKKDITFVFRSGLEHKINI